MSDRRARRFAAVLSVALAGVAALGPATASADIFVQHQRSSADAGFGCGPFASPLAPAAGQSEVLRTTFLPSTTTGVYYATNGGTPAGANQIPGIGTSYIVASACPVPFSNVGELSLPGQAAGTTVRYVVDGMNLGTEHFDSGAPACLAIGCATVYTYTVGAAPGGGGGGGGSGAKPSNAFSLGKVTRKRRRGTASLTATVPGPGVLSLAGHSLRAQQKVVRAQGAVKLAVKAVGRKRQALKASGKAKVKVRVAYTPTGGDPGLKVRRLKLLYRS
jgi:hypothetical protein